MKNFFLSCHWSRPNYSLLFSPPHPQSLIRSPKISTSTVLALLSPPHLSHTQLEVKELFSFRAVVEEVGGGWGGGLLSGPPPQWLFMPGPLGHQHDNVTMWQGFFKRDPVFVKCFSPLKSNHGAGSGDLKSAHERRGPTLITQCERDGPFD